MKTAWSKKSDIFEWEPWFAWHPVKVGNGRGFTRWVWREWVERKVGFIGAESGWCYREPQSCQEQRRAELA